VDTLLLDGSEVRAVRRESGDGLEGDTVCVAFAAACVRRDPENSSGATGAGRDSVWGHLTGLTLRLRGVVRATDADALAWSPDAALEDAMGTLSGGEVRHADQVWRALPLPCNVNGPMTLSLRFRAGPEWVWQGQGLAIEAEANSRFFESYAC
jgi:hypothetical protein